MFLITPQERTNLKKKIKKAAVKIKRKNCLAYLGRFTGG